MCSSHVSINKRAFKKSKKIKKLDFIIWIDPSTNIILKVAYERMGRWEYKLKKYN